MTSVPRSLALDMTPSLMSSLWGMGNMLHEADRFSESPKQKGSRNYKNHSSTRWQQYITSEWTASGLGALPGKASAPALPKLHTSGYCLRLMAATA